MSDSPAVEPENDAAIAERGSNALRKALNGEPLQIAVRVKNNRVDYSFVNTPPMLATGRLLAALLHAGSHYPQKRMSMKAPTKRLRATVGTGPSTVTMKHTIEVDFDAEVIRSTQAQKVTLQVLSVIVQNLAQEAAAAGAPGKPTPPTQLN